MWYLQNKDEKRGEFIVSHLNLSAVGKFDQWVMQFLVLILPRNLVSLLVSPLVSVLRSAKLRYSCQSFILSLVCQMIHCRVFSWFFSHIIGLSDLVLFL